MRFAFAVVPLGAVAVVASAAPSVKAGAGASAGPPESVLEFDLACKNSVIALLKAKGAIDDSPHKPGLRATSATLASEVLHAGQSRGSLEIFSFVRPPSSYSVIQYSAAGPLKSPESCPLDQTYLVFIQGGFQQQRAVVFGPLQ